MQPETVGHALLALAFLFAAAVMVLVHELTRHLDVIRVVLGGS